MQGTINDESDRDKPLERLADQTETDDKQWAQGILRKSLEPLHSFVDLFKEDKNSEAQAFLCLKERKAEEETREPFHVEQSRLVQDAKRGMKVYFPTELVCMETHASVEAKKILEDEEERGVYEKIVADEEEDDERYQQSEEDEDD